MKGGGYVTLDKPQYGYDVVLDGARHTEQRVIVKNPTFKVCGSRIIEYARSARLTQTVERSISMHRDRALSRSGASPRIKPIR